MHLHTLSSFSHILPRSHSDRIVLSGTQLFNLILSHIVPKSTVKDIGEKSKSIEFGKNRNGEKEIELKIFVVS